MSSQYSVKGMVIAVLGTLGMEEGVRHLYWKIRLWRTRCCIELCGTRRQFWAVDRQIQGRLQGTSEHDQLEEFLNNIREGDVVWDVGSFVGLYAVFAAHRVGSSGQVGAFEPDRTAFRRLAQNCRLNGINNTQLLQVALSDSVGSAELFVSRKHVGSLAPLSGGTRGQRIELDTGDRLVSAGTLRAPNLVKIDVEGAELHVLRGMQGILSHDACRYVLLEVHPTCLASFGSSLEDIRSLLLSCGFSIRSETKRGKECHWIAQK